VKPSFASGRDLTVESSDRSGKLQMSKIRIVSAKVHPRITEVCAAENGGDGCKGSSAAALRDAPDLALIKLAADIPNAAVTPISGTAAKVDEYLIPVGFGCIDRIGGAYEDNARFGVAEVIAPGVVAHRGSGVSAAQATALSGVYVYTEGPALNDKHLAGLCPGDSGGPLFRQSGNVVAVVGVSSSYTFLPDKLDVPATDWFSRLDTSAQHDVFAWLEREGATVTR
jgi:hypothetical protein